MSGADDLRRLAARTRELADELDRARPDLLSVSELNRALRHLLSTQAAILEALSAGNPAVSASRPQIRVTSSSGPEKRPSSKEAKPIELDPSELLEDPILDLDAPAPTNGNGNGSHAAAEPEQAPVAAPSGVSNTETWLNEKRTVSGTQARQFVCQFDNRDNDFEKGLDKLNRWISAGPSGTPFQWRGDQAYLNLNGSAAATVRNYEDQLMTRMGFSRRLGRLEVPGLEGEVVIYERPS